MKEKMPLIQLHNIEKSYGKQTVLMIDELQISRRDIITITGPNGAGKTTLLNILAGISLPNKGKRICSKELNALRLCYIPQSGGFYRNLSLIENMKIWSSLYGQSLKPNIIDHWFFKVLGLTSIIHKPVGELSVGFQKIATMACALSANPNGLFLDEPTSGLDQEKTNVFFKWLEEFCLSAVFVIITSHNSLKVSSDCIEISLKEGRIQCKEY